MSRVKDLWLISTNKPESGFGNRGPLRFLLDASPTEKGQVDSQRAAEVALRLIAYNTRQPSFVRPEPEIRITVWDIDGSGGQYPASTRVATWSDQKNAYVMPSGATVEPINPSDGEPCILFPLGQAM